MFHIRFPLCLSPSPSVSQRASSGGSKQPSAVRPLIEIVRRDRDERVGRDERTPLITDFKVFSHLVTSQVRSMTKNDHMVFRR